MIWYCPSFLSSSSASFAIFLWFFLVFKTLPTEKEIVQTKNRSTNKKIDSVKLSSHAIQVFISFSSFKFRTFEWRSPTKSLHLCIHSYTNPQINFLSLTLSLSSFNSLIVTYIQTINIFLFANLLKHLHSTWWLLFAAGSDEQIDEQINERQLRSLLPPHDILNRAPNDVGRAESSGSSPIRPISNELDTGLNSKNVDIEVLSSADHVQVSVDGVSVLDESASPPSGRGLHVLVLSQHSGRLMARRVFDTYTNHEDEQLQLFLGMLRPGRLLVFAIKDEASFKLHSAARQLLHRLGSRWASQISWRDMWAMITYSQPFAAGTFDLSSGIAAAEFKPMRSAIKIDHHTVHASKSMAEQLSRRLQHQQWASPVRLTHRLMLQTPADSDCPAWLEQPDGQRRAYFCDQVDGYGQVCDCADPAPITFHPLDVSCVAWRFFLFTVSLYRFNWFLFVDIKVPRRNSMKISKCRLLHEQRRF